MPSMLSPIKVVFLQDFTLITSNMKDWLNIDFKKDIEYPCYSIEHNYDPNLPKGDVVLRFRNLKNREGKLVNYLIHLAEPKYSHVSFMAKYESNT